MASVEAPKRSAVRSRAPLKLQALRSLPLNFRFTSGGSPSMAEGEKREVGIDLGALEEEEGENGGVEENEESPYSSKTTSREARPVEEAEEEEEEGGVDSAAAARSPAALPSQVESRWGDTSSYCAKKVSHSSIHI